MIASEHEISGACLDASLTIHASLDPSSSPGLHRSNAHGNAELLQNEVFGQHAPQMRGGTSASTVADCSNTVVYSAWFMHLQRAKTNKNIHHNH